MVILERTNWPYACVCGNIYRLCNDWKDFKCFFLLLCWKTNFEYLSCVFMTDIMYPMPGEDKLVFALLMTQNRSQVLLLKLTFIYSSWCTHTWLLLWLFSPSCNKTGMATFFRNPLNHSWINTIFLTHILPRIVVGEFYSIENRSRI